MMDAAPLVLLLAVGLASADDSPYRPSAAPPRPRLELSVVVPPFEDYREFCRDDYAIAPRIQAKYSSPDERACTVQNIQKAEQKLQLLICPQFRFDTGEKLLYVDADAERYAKWLAMELAASGYFKSVEYKTWKELAEAHSRPDVLVLGSLARAVGVELVAGECTKGAHWAGGTQQAIELRLYRRGASPLADWTGRYSAKRDEQVTQTVFGRSFTHATAWPSGESISATFVPARDDLYEQIRKTP